MANLTVYTDRAVRSSAAKQYLTNLGVAFDEVNVEQDSSAVEFLESKGRDLKHYPLPQFYVGESLAYENGFKDFSTATAEQINSKVEEINAANA